MKKINLGQKDIIHFVGIGGIGMSGLAQIMNNMGFIIQGSDQNKNKNTISCAKSKIKVLIGHSSSNIKKVNILVKSTAIKNNNIEKEVLNFLKERMRNILKEKKIRSDIIDASISSHIGDNFLDLYKKNILMNKYLNKEVGINTISSYKRAFNIIEKIEKEINGRPDPVLFRKDEEKFLFEKINEIRKNFTVKEDKKNYENMLIQLSEVKPFTDNFFDKVIVNDENIDIKNNRLELLKMFCNTFNTFIDFSKLEGLNG